MCIGRDFAYAEAVLALAMICRAVRLAPTGAPGAGPSRWSRSARTARR